MTRSCQNCKKEFLIEPEDFKFYDKISVPPPTWCPECRMIRRFTFRNERSLYKRKCDLCKKEIIAMYPDGAFFPVYCRSCWYSDGWDPLTYGRDYDFSKPFFKQFRELQNVVPRIALQVDNCENCDYANQVANSKNLYLVTSASDNENIYYSHRVMHSRDIIDCLLILNGELCATTIECLNSSRIVYSNDCADSLDLKFCYDARGSQNCFMSSNLRQKTYVFNNRPVTKEKFQQKIKGIDTGSYQKISVCLQQFSEMQHASLHKFSNFKNVVNFVGHTASNAKKCFRCFNVSDVENCGYCTYVSEAKDSFDINNGCCVMELNYEVCTMGVNAYNVRFSIDAWPEVRDILYSDSCRSGSSNLFGCISLRNKSYCILNKQYTKEEYERMVPKIIEHMNQMPYIDKKGRVYKYGEFFPPELSPFAYNETIAQEYFPLTKEEALDKGYSWKDPEPRNYQIQIPNAELPDHIKDVKDDIVNKIIECAHQKAPPSALTGGGGCNEQCTEAYKIIPQELTFLRRMNLPLPRLCPNCRHYQRIKQRNPLKLWHRKCQCAGEKSENGIYANTGNHIHHKKDEHCPNEFETTYAPERPEIVYCENCYLREVV